MTNMLCVQLQGPEIAEDDESSEVICYFTNEYRASDRKRGKTFFRLKRLVCLLFAIVAAAVFFARFLGQTTLIFVCSIRSYSFGFNDNLTSFNVQKIRSPSLIKHWLKAVFFNLVYAKPCLRFL